MTTITLEEFTKQVQAGDTARKAFRVLIDGIAYIVNVKREADAPDDSEMTEEEFYAMLDHSKAQAEAGHVHTKRPDETMEQFLDRLIS